MSEQPSYAKPSICGEVQTVSEREHEGVRLYAIALKGLTGWFRAGERQPSCLAGDLVEFQVGPKMRIEGLSVLRKDKKARAALCSCYNPTTDRDPYCPQHGAE